MTEAYIKDLKPRDTNKIIEAKVYRAWIHRDYPYVTDKGFRAILLDKQVFHTCNDHITKILLL